jgi:hypothetical protein
MREKVHQIIDTLPDERLSEVLDYLDDLTDGKEELGGDARAAIEEGLQDLQSGRKISLTEYRRTRGL